MRRRCTSERENKGPTSLLNRKDLSLISHDSGIHEARTSTDGAQAISTENASNQTVHRNISNNATIRLITFVTCTLLNPLLRSRWWARELCAHLRRGLPGAAH